ncbi:hypothetical protein MASR2M17_02190 [Aminivibrio sp.]
MNRYPRLLVSREKIRENAFRVVRRCAEGGIAVAGVVKGVCAYPPVVRSFIEGGCRELADSRMANIAALRKMKTGLPLLLLRIPMPSELPLVAELADCSLVSAQSPYGQPSREGVRIPWLHYGGHRHVRPRRPPGGALPE